MDHRESALCEARDLMTHPRTERDERGDDREHARQVRERRILNLRGRLNRSDNQPDERRNADNRQ